MTKREVKVPDMEVVDPPEACPMCAAALTEEQTFCSPACEEKYQALQKAEGEAEAKAIFEFIEETSWV